MESSQFGGSDQRRHLGNLIQPAAEITALMALPPCSDYVDIPLGSPQPRSDLSLSSRPSVGCADLALAPPPSAVGTGLAPPPSAVGTGLAPPPSAVGTGLAPPPSAVGTNQTMALAPAPSAGVNSVLAPSANMVNVQTNPPHVSNPGVALNPTPFCQTTIPTYYSAATPTVGATLGGGSTPGWTGIVSGYDGTTPVEGDGKVLPPPPAQPPAPAAVTIADSTKWIFPPITEDAAKKAFLKYAKNKCCYGRGPARELTVQEFRTFDIYRYRLETFTESRACKWVTESYMGQAVDSAVYGPAPQPWDIAVEIPPLFKDVMHKMPIPHTASLKTCPRCMGMGRAVCPKCHGTGRVQCWVCQGSGRRLQMEMCHNCYGNGAESCRMCHNNYGPCMGCSGNGQILNYIQLTIAWKNNIFEFIGEHNSEFPNKLFQDVNGEKIFTDEQVLVPPLINTPVSSINNASQNALDQHHTQFSSSCRVLRQRQTVEWLPLAKLQYKWKEIESNFFVYGKGHKVHTTTYPAKCCCAVM
ncbi:protein SSUH2 homolog [Pelodytes ibericus]